jgi:hypothetical protein
MGLRLGLLAVAIFLIASPTASAAQTAQIWNYASETVVVRDNGVTVCQAAPGGTCSWQIADGSHTIEITAFGVTLSTPVTIPGEYVSWALQDCDFMDGGCDEG